MQELEDLEIGLMFWAKDDARQTLREVKKFGLRAGQIGFPGELSLDGAAEKWKHALNDEKFTAVTAVCSYVGEKYVAVPTVAATVGLVPRDTRTERIARTKAVSDVAKVLGIDSVGCHIGFVPEEAESLLYREVLEVTREICDHCAANGQRFTLETGQEPAEVMLTFIHDVKRENLKINYDPANMILYGTGDPIEALGVLAPHVISVHCKDGDWPDRDDPNALGVEMALGEGSVGVDLFIHRLKELGYRGILSIEREEPDAEKRTNDITAAVQLLRWLTGRD
jgi:sugar phosphate isomerase/epimerase